MDLVSTAPDKINDTDRQTQTDGYLKTHPQKPKTHIHPHTNALTHAHAQARKHTRTRTHALKRMHAISWGVATMTRWTTVASVWSRYWSSAWIVIAIYHWSAYRCAFNSRPLLIYGETPMHIKRPSMATIPRVLFSSPCLLVCVRDRPAGVCILFQTPPPYDEIYIIYISFFWSNINFTSSKFSSAYSCAILPSLSSLVLTWENGVN